MCSAVCAYRVGQKVSPKQFAFSAQPAKSIDVGNLGLKQLRKVLSWSQTPHELVENLLEIPVFEQVLDWIEYFAARTKYCGLSICLRRHHNRLYMTKCNIRVSASYYATFYILTNKHIAKSLEMILRCILVLHSTDANCLRKRSRSKYIFV